MKRLVVLAMAVMGLLSCGKITDIPVVKFEQNEITVTSKGGGFIIPVHSTGVDEVRITYRGQENWQVDAGTGDKTPVPGWCKLVKVIEHYEQTEGTRDLAEWRSGIELEVLANETGVERVAYVTVESFQASATIAIKQGF